MKLSSCFVLIDNIPPILLHGGSDTELTFNSDYCCRRFLVEPSKTSLFFEQCLLLHSSIVSIYHRVLSGICRSYSHLCETPCSSYTSVSSSGTTCLTPKPLILPALKLQKIPVFGDRKSPRQNHSKLMAIEPITGSCGNNDG